MRVGDESEWDEHFLTRLAHHPLLTKSLRQASTIKGYFLGVFPMEENYKTGEMWQEFSKVQSS